MGKMLIVAGALRFAWGVLGAKIWRQMVKEATDQAFKEILPWTGSGQLEMIKVQTVDTPPMPLEAPNNPGS